jgi:predicted transcriptional regulator
MKKDRNVVLTTGNPDDFFKAAREHAAKLDKKAKIKPEIKIIFDDPADLSRALSVERVRVIQTVRAGQGTSFSLTALAAKLNRDRKAITRDVTLLEELGLLRTREQKNPGHGKVKIVETVAEKYHLTTTI